MKKTLIIITLAVIVVAFLMTVPGHSQVQAAPASEPSQLPSIVAIAVSVLTFLTLVVTKFLDNANEKNKRIWAEQDRVNAQKDREKAEADRRLAEDTNRKAELIVEKATGIHDLTNSTMSDLRKELAKAVQKIEDQQLLLSQIARSNAVKDAAQAIESAKSRPVDTTTPPPPSSQLKDVKSQLKDVEKQIDHIEDVTVETHEVVTELKDRE